MTTEAAVRTFFSAPNFAVVGASSNPAKFGHKIFAWYLAHSLPVTPVNPASATVSALGADHQAAPSLSALPTDPRQTAVSVITPPPVTLQVLQEARRLGVPAVWLQPGTYDDEVMAFARSGGEDAFQAVVGGAGGRGSEGWCVLVDGERGAKSAGKL